MKAIVQFDEAEFKDFFTFATVEINNATRTGMQKAVKAWKRDALFTVPKVPEDTGRLKRSHRAKVEKLTDWVGTLLANTPYAATVHSGISVYGTPMVFRKADTGSHWISSKLHKYADKYFGIIQSELSK